MMDKRYLAKQGRNGDTKVRSVLGVDSHVNKIEAQWIDEMGLVGQLLTSQLGSGDINPQTGLPEYSWFSKNILNPIFKGYAGSHKGSDKDWDRDQRLEELAQASMTDLIGQFNSNVGEGGKYDQQRGFATDSWGQQAAGFKTSYDQILSDISMKMGGTGLTTSGENNYQQGVADTDYRLKVDEGLLGYNKSMYDIDQAQTDEAWSVQAALNEMASNTTASFNNPYSTASFNYDGFDINDYTGG
jgi:hypothetical protein